MRIACLMLSFVVLAAGCGKGDSTVAPKSEQKTAAPAPSSSGAAHHGAVVGLGEVRFGTDTFSVARHGPATPGHEGAFVVYGSAKGNTLSLILWVEDGAGTPCSAPSSGDRVGDEWHFHVTPRADAGVPERVVVRLRDMGRDERAGLGLHGDAEPKRDGIGAPLLDAAGATAGWLELKLHDDKGDLEVWFMQNGKAGLPLDLPLDAAVKAVFHGKADATVELRPRDTTKNADESGQANVRAGLTNYFIFPGDTGADASWLRGATFKSLVTVRVTVGNRTLESLPFMLAPHVH